MKNEIVPLLKSVAVVVVGVLIANYVQTTLLTKKAPTASSTTGA